MSTKTYMKILIGSFIIGISLSFFGCGSSNGGSGGAGASPALPAIAPGTIPGSCGYGYQVISGNSCYDPCSGAYGFLTPASGVTVCEVSRSFVEGFYSYQGVYSVTPSTPSNNFAFPTQINVAAGDKLTIQGVTGGWGTINQPTSSSCLFGLATCTWQTQSGCTLSVQANGAGASSMNEGMPEGLFVSDGSASYLANSGQAIRIGYSGTLRLGFNLPMQNNTCGGAQLSLTIQHCVDASGNSYACP